ncbi:MAG TPA: hypothetical protein VFU41_06850 [Gemmatimonadales bacterium]|nr:hypothetical protein [Gemmatimonadales bacterium]
MRLRHGSPVGKLVGGGALIALSLFMLLGFFSSSATLSFPVAVLTLVVAVGVPGVAGAALIRSYVRERDRFAEHREQLRLETFQAEIVKLAGARGGKLTVVELVSDLAFDAATAEAALHGLVTQGVADIEVTDSGLLVYTFPDVQRLPEKGASKDILDE